MEKLKISEEKREVKKKEEDKDILLKKNTVFTFHVVNFFFAYS